MAFDDGAEDPLLLELLDRELFPGVGALLEEESSLCFSLCFFPIFNLIMICFFCCDNRMLV